MIGELGLKGSLWFKILHFIGNKRFLLLFISGLLFVSLSGQNRYSIDKSELKQSRRLTIKEFFVNKRIEREERKVNSKMDRLDRKTDAIAKQYAKRKQIGLF